MTLRQAQDDAYDDVAEIKAMLAAIAALLERMAYTLDRMADDTADIDCNLADIAEAIIPMPQVAE